MTADELAARVLDDAALPSRVDTTTAKILDTANSELASRVVNLLKTQRGGFLLDSLDYTIVANQARYAIPPRALNSGIELINYVDSAGNEAYPLNQIGLREIGNNYPFPYLTGSSSASYPQGFFTDSASIVLSPVPTVASGSLRVYYARRPGKLVSDTVVASQHTTVGTIASVSATTITLNANHNGWPASTTVDIMAAQSPYKLLYKDAPTSTAAAGTATILTTGTNLTTLGISAGDYVTLSRQSYTPEIPQEWHELLLDLTVAKMFNKVGELSSEASVRLGIREKYASLLAATSPRAAQALRKFRPRF